MICTTPVCIAAAMFLLSVAAFAVRAVSFGLFMLALTPAGRAAGRNRLAGHRRMGDRGRPRGTDDGRRRSIAVGANFLLWPSREPDLVAAEVKQAIAAHGAYADADFAALLGEADGISA